MPFVVLHSACPVSTKYDFGRNRRASTSAVVSVFAKCPKFASHLLSSTLGASLFFLFCFVFHKKIKFMCLCMDSEQSCDRSFAAKTKKKNRLAPSLSVKPKIGPYDTCKYQKYISISFMDSYFDSSLYLCDISYKIALK